MIQRAHARMESVSIDSATTTRTTPLLSAIEPPKSRRLRLIVTVAVVTLGSSMQSGFATGVVCRTSASNTRPVPHQCLEHTPSHLA